MSEDLNYGDVLTALQVRTDTLHKIRHVETVKEASRLAGKALCTGPGQKAILKECVRYDNDSKKQEL